MLSNLKTIRFLLRAFGSTFLSPLLVLGWVVFLWEYSSPILAQPAGGVLAIRGATLDRRYRSSSGRGNNNCDSQRAH